MHKFHLGQALAYRATRGLYAASGAYVVTAKLRQRDGEYEYRIRNLAEAHERKVARIGTPGNSENEAQPGGSKGKR
jgi:hypothetical protein